MEKKCAACACVGKDVKAEWSYQMLLFPGVFIPICSQHPVFDRFGGKVHREVHP
jgi:hypothetical protein